MQLKQCFLFYAGYVGCVTGQLVYANNQVDVTKDDDKVAANFPSLPEIDLFSPAFTCPQTVPASFSNGTSGPTDESTLNSFLHNLASRNKWMTYHNPTFQSEEGRSLPYVFLTSSSSPPMSSQAGTNKTNDKVRIWMQGGVHGNEPAGDQALLALLGKMDADPNWTASILEKVDILMLPRYNPDGVAYFQRYLASSLDPTATIRN